jgi:hypothetical protein
MITILADQHFGARDGGRPFLDSHWAEPEADFTWSLGIESFLSLDVPVGSTGLVLELTVRPFTDSDDLPAQRLLLSANATPLGEFRLEGLQTLTMPIDDACLANTDTLTLRLYCPDAARPADLGYGDDNRRLGLRLYRATLLHVPAMPDFIPAPGADYLEQDFTFGWGGTGNACLLDGWSGPEHDYHWAIGRHSRLRLPIACPTSAYTVLLEIFPIGDDRLKQQRLVVGANDRLVSTLAVTTRTLVTLALPPLDPGQQSVVITFDNLDAATGRQFALYEDGRPFAFMLLGLRLIRLSVQPPAPASSAPARINLPAAELAARFDTLGHGCMLTNFQAKLGVERISLLRFTGIDAVSLVRGLVNRFYLLGRPDRIETFAFDDDGRWWIRETTHNMRCRSPWDMTDAMPQPSIAWHMARRFWFLRRRFLEDLGLVGRIYVFFLQPATRMEAEAVAAALRLSGPHTVLWLVQDGSVAPGTVLRLGPGLLAGGLDRIPGSAASTYEAWLSVLASAWALSQSA